MERRALKRAVAFLVSTVMVIAPLFNTVAHAQMAASGKIAKDLQTVIAAPTTPSLNWAKDVNGVRLVKVLIVSNSTDPDLTALRSDVLARGGAVYLRYVSVTALSAMLPASQVAAIAARADVQSLSPNRLTTRTSSTLEATVGALTPAVRTYSSGSTYTGLDGSGVGIAVLDSGIVTHHFGFHDDAGNTRIKRSVDFQKVGDATLVGAKDWTVGIDASVAMSPGSAATVNYEAKIDNASANPPDLYGHGSHVASVAAGYGKGNSVDNTGVASPGIPWISLAWEISKRSDVLSPMSINTIPTPPTARARTLFL